MGSLARYYCSGFRAGRRVKGASAPSTKGRRRGDGLGIRASRCARARSTKKLKRELKGRLEKGSCQGQDQGQGYSNKADRDRGREGESERQRRRRRQRHRGETESRGRDREAGTEIDRERDKYNRGKQMCIKSTT